MKLVLLKTFENIIDARLFASKLESEGVQTYIENEHTITIDPLLSNALGGIRVMVTESDYLIAHKLLTEYSNTAIVDEEGVEMTCPKCGSESIENGIKDFGGFKGAISFVIALIFFVVPLSKYTKYRCRKCTHLFKTIS